MASHERTGNEGDNIVSLAGLLSSLLIYNKLGGCFDDNAVDSLGRVALIMRDLYEHSGECLLVAVRLKQLSAPLVLPLAAACHADI
jgi:hypothetical protein